ALRQRLRLRVRAPYQVADMAADALGVLDALGIEHAHICGASMGGMIAQRMVAAHPGRIKSLTLLMTSSGARGLPRARAEVGRVLLSRPTRARDPAATVAYLERLFGVIGSPAYRSEPAVLRSRLQAAVARAWHPAGSTRQLVAIIADADRSHLLGRIRVPTTIVHGAADPLVPVEHARDLQRKIPGARLEIIDGMGHDLPPVLMPRLAQAIAAVAVSRG
ncbi:MAG TPA: alpha/beta fold hydrolase, partial [Burkholderiaceae bacterium]|nr:alpha/beta fold hydrolase [Burkholderiaceae bacterium]